MMRAAGSWPRSQAGRQTDKIKDLRLRGGKIDDDPPAVGARDRLFDLETNVIGVPIALQRILVERLERRMHEGAEIVAIDDARFGSLDHFWFRDLSSRGAKRRRTCSSASSTGAASSSTGSASSRP